jgi:hypothetical protein
MEIASRAIEMTGTVDAHRHLVLDDALPIKGPRKVRVIILLPEEEDINESEWLRAAPENPAFAFLEDPEEDIYSMTDGKPFKDKE